MYIVEIMWMSKSFGYCMRLVVCRLYINISLHLGWAFELACSWDLLVKGGSYPGPGNVEDGHPVTGCHQERLDQQTSMAP